MQFIVAELFGDFDKSSLEDDSPETVFVGEKCGDSRTVRFTNTCLAFGCDF